VQELDKAFVAKNKKALLQEIAIQLARGRELIDFASMNSDGIAGAFAGVCSSFASIESFFKQYMLLRSGEIPPQNLIGFSMFNEDDGEGYGPEDDGDNEDIAVPEAKKKNEKTKRSH